MMAQSATPVLEPAELLGTISSDEPRPLPYSAYPKARDVAHHGVQALPPSLPLVDFGRAQPHRSRRYSTLVAADLTRSQVLQMARVVAASFARREPQSRHLRPPKHPPPGSWRRVTPIPLAATRSARGTKRRSCTGSS